MPSAAAAEEPRVGSWIGASGSPPSPPLKPDVDVAALPGGGAATVRAGGGAWLRSIWGSGAALDGVGGAGKGPGGASAGGGTDCGAGGVGAGGGGAIAVRLGGENAGLYPGNPGANPGVLARPGFGSSSDGLSNTLTGGAAVRCGAGGVNAGTDGGVLSAIAGLKDCGGPIGAGFIRPARGSGPRCEGGVNP